MKKGKCVKLNLFNPIKSVYGTVDSTNLKSVYINIQSWVSPKSNQLNWPRIVSNLNKEIKNSVFNSIDKNLFKELPTDSRLLVVLTVSWLRLLICWLRSATCLSN